MIHLYCGDGKGKTTAAMGLALRMAGRGRGVVIAQFLKGEDTGERRALEKLPQVKLLPVPERVKFSFQLTQAEREAEAGRYRELMDRAEAAAGEPGCGLLVLDEVCAAVNTGLLPLERVLSCLDRAQCEVVLTGRDPSPEMQEAADYVTEMKKIKHPFDQGIGARSPFTNLGPSTSPGNILQIWQPVSCARLTSETVPHPGIYGIERRLQTRDISALNIGPTTKSAPSCK